MPFSDTVNVLALVGLILATVAVHRLTLHPLSHVPGPWIFSVSSLPQWIAVFLGIEPQTLARYHRRYNTRVLRIAPNLVSISDPNALTTIYVANGGFLKDGRYCNFDVNGAPTIFSAIDKAYRDVRAKAVLTLFGPATIRAGEGAQNVQQHVERFVARLEEEKRRALRSDSTALYRVDILDLALRLSMDVMTGYMFDRPYGALCENATPEARSQSPKFTESPWLQAIAAFGYYSMLPNWLFSLVLAVHTSLWDPARGAALGRVDAFVQLLVAEEQMRPSNPTSPTYHGRLRAAGATTNEVIGICEGSLFAGTSSTGQTLAIILFHLVRQPNVHERLAQELDQDSPSQAGLSDIPNVPYLRAVVSEGLRLAMTNPAPLTRTVPQGGCLVDGVYLPEGVSVGASIHVLHHDPEAFPDPLAFRPERWLEGSDKRRRDLCFFPFGLGSRSCIGRNLALEELYVAVAATVKSDVLEGAVTCQERIKVNGCFNGEVEGHTIGINWR
ncbi:cytochrome P450 [Aspergillus heteromorphus CBS 117.55]|uniref:Cytochrome P450 n=1 Tax=Aspergillus heteromorphus CBS 117.55 TaxID=1448321 RepID=A0A317V487_9EURO|nr:cytochrome P450 [Aspergillus heteromorphus CBS 117.55]PWY67888.1 cytochrome P450 [Aspergillus heteromorphus CBS 117.55]